MKLNTHDDILGKINALIESFERMGAGQKKAHASSYRLIMNLLELALKTIEARSRRSELKDLEKRLEDLEESLKQRTV